MIIIFNIQIEKIKKVQNLFEILLTTLQICDDQRYLKAGEIHLALINAHLLKTLIHKGYKILG